MSNYIRSKQKGGTYFFTVVTYQRQKIFLNDKLRLALRHSISEVRKHYPFTIEAWVLLPDHMHCIWTLPNNDTNYSKRWGLIKRSVSQQMKSNYSKQTTIQSKIKRRESTIWQRRFWEHQILNENDYRTHMDYIHYNPVKHGLVASVKDWPYSSFSRCVKEGFYDGCWGSEYQVKKGGFGE